MCIINVHLELKVHSHRLEMNVAQSPGAIYPNYWNFAITHTDLFRLARKNSYLLFVMHILRLFYSVIIIHNIIIFYNIKVIQL